MEDWMLDDMETERAVLVGLHASVFKEDEDASWETLDELEALLGKYVPGAEALRTKLKKYDAAYKALTAENAALEKQLGASSKESVRKKLEINEKLRELDELHRMVDGIPPEILQAAKQVAAHKQQER